MNDWADKIRVLELAGWSLTELGKSIELSPQALSDIKQGRTKAPTGMAAVRLHNLYSTGAKPAQAA
jgi:plasmid maintenance system antidote protein VapI